MFPFCELYSNKFFVKSLRILGNALDREMKQQDFILAFRLHGSYFVKFLEIEPDLLKYDLINYKIDKNRNNMICLTEKGLNLLNLINKMKELIQTLNEIE